MSAETQQIDIKQLSPEHRKALKKTTGTGRKNREAKHRQTA
ncbi:hypothetical protein [Flavobacterium psychrophilum]|nr:hypothetical protein [Flavobacterium psychrophilum]SNB10910.1 hypothetical protein JIP1600_1930016 [Flavobacterium psychrophilum]